MFYFGTKWSSKVVEHIKVPQSSCSNVRSFDWLIGWTWIWQSINQPTCVLSISKMFSINIIVFFGYIFACRGILIWFLYRSIPRTSVLSYQPIRGQKWQNWMMLRDVRRRAYVQRDGRVRLRLRSLLRTKTLPKEFAEYVREDIYRLPRDSGYRRISDRCVVTSRPRGLVARYRMSRIAWRNLADHNQISGVMRAKWGNRNDPVWVSLWNSIELVACWLSWLIDWLIDWLIECVHFLFTVTGTILIPIYTELCAQAVASVAPLWHESGSRGAIWRIITNLPVGAKWGNRNDPCACLVDWLIWLKWCSFSVHSYWHHLDPDLHGTLRAVDPVYDPERKIEEAISLWENEAYEGAVHLRTPPRDLYNKDLFKDPRSVYPPDLRAPVWAKSHRIARRKFYNLSI